MRKNFQQGNGQFSTSNLGIIFLGVKKKELNYIIGG